MTQVEEKKVLRELLTLVPVTKPVVGYEAWGDEVEFS